MPDVSLNSEREWKRRRPEAALKRNKQRFLNWTSKNCGQSETYTNMYREGQISALDRVQKKAAKFAHHKNSPNWETLASRRKLSRICAFFKAYCGERAWKPIGDRLERPHYLSRLDHERKIRSRMRRKDIGKYSFVNRTIQQWNQLPAEVLEILPCKPITFKKRVR